MKAKEFYSLIESWLIQQLNTLTERPVVFCISGPQGCGKSTLANELTQRLAKQSFKAQTVSIDDFYLSRSEQQQLAESSKNSYLQSRGYPGTHDVELGAKVLFQLKQGLPCKIPVYDKSKFKGKGDRLPEANWKVVGQKQDLIIFEGWMLGFKPQPETDSADLNEINSYIQKYEKWLEPIDIFLHLKPENLRDVISWRVEAEQKMRAAGKGAMTDQEAKDYIASFLPAYELYNPTIESRQSQFTIFKTIQIGKDRMPS